MSRAAKALVDTMSMDELDAEDQLYFTYRPLSNLPTPPPSSRNSSAEQSPKAGLDDDDQLLDRFLGPSIHLVNLIPTSASLTAPSVPLVQALLGRACLPLETIALAVCILDSLNSKFALSWRLQCPLLLPPDASHSPNKRHSLAGPVFQQRQLHIDSVQPELIILAALVIASKFTEDRQDSTQYYCAAWGRNVWSCEQLNATERCICENLNYRIKPLLDDQDLIDETLVDMQLAARHYRPTAVPPPARLRFMPVGSRDLTLGHSKSKSMSVSTAMMGLGLPLTPVDTPSSDEGQGRDSSDYLSVSRPTLGRGLSTVGEELDARR